MFDREGFVKLVKDLEVETDSSGDRLSSNGLSLVPFFGSPSATTPRPCQKEVAGLVRDFGVSINRGKTLDRKEYANKLLNLIDVRLFGFLGTQAYVNPGDPWPHNSYLAATKACFRGDVLRMAKVVSRWSIVGHEVGVNGELSFRAGGESLAFLESLRSFALRESDPYLRRAGFAEEWLDRAFGTVPGEPHQDISGNWDPLSTAGVIRKSLDLENSIIKVGSIINEIKAEHHVKLVAETGGAIAATRLRPRRGAKADSTTALDFDRGFFDFGSIDEAPTRAYDLGTIKRISYLDIADMGVERSGEERAYFRGQAMDLHVDAITRAEAFLDEIPRAILDDLRDFLSSIAGRLAVEVPFILSPELYILSGPVRIRSVEVRVYEDPLVVLRFSEFPSMLIPVTWWLPVSNLSAWDPTGKGAKAVEILGKDS